jgi:hypothetical protein
MIEETAAVEETTSREKPEPCYIIEGEWAKEESE